MDEREYVDDWDYLFRLLKDKDDLRFFLMDNSFFRTCVINFCGKLEGFVMEGVDFGRTGYFYVLLYTDKNYIRFYPSGSFLSKSMAIIRMKEVLRYFPLFGFQTRFIYRK